LNNEITNEINLDSLKIKIPMSYVEVVDHNLKDIISEHLVNENTGDMVRKVHRRQRSKYYPITIFGVDYEIIFHVKKWHNPRTHTVTEYLHICFNAKIVEGDYFDGINQNNIQSIYQKLIGCKVANFSYETFIKLGEATNMEFCRNFRLTNFPQCLSKLTNRLHQDIQLNPKPLLKNGKNQQTLKFTKKEDETHAKPYVIIYNKELELITKSHVFFNTFLSDVDITDLRRIEFRIKDLGHARSLGLRDSSLHTLLNLSQQDKEEMLKKFVSSYLSQPLTFDKTSLTRGKLVYLDALIALIGQGFCFGDACNMLLYSQPTRQAKSDKRRELTAIYETYIKGNLSEEFTPEERTILGLPTMLHPINDNDS